MFCFSLLLQKYISLKIDIAMTFRAHYTCSVECIKIEGRDIIFLKSRTICIFSFWRLCPAQVNAVMLCWYCVTGQWYCWSIAS